MKLFKNKKGFFPAIGITLTVGTLVVIAVIIALLMVGFGVLLNFITTNIFAIGGAFLLIVSFILLSKKSVSQKFGGFLIVLSILLILIQFSGVTQTVLPTTCSPDSPCLAIPHNGAYKCEQTSEKPGISYTLTKTNQPFVISSKTIGFNGYTVKNIQVKSGSPIPFNNVEVIYYVCPADSTAADSLALCGEAHKSGMLTGTTYQNVINIPSIDLTKQSIKVYNYYVGLFGTANPTSFAEGGKVTYDSQEYGLTYYSTTYNPAGSTIPGCSGSCDLSCPSIGLRQSTYTNITNDLTFSAPGNTAVFLEYWTSIPYDLNSQGGATVYDSKTKTFCLAGNVYQASTLTLKSGTYIYPNTLTLQQKTCCPGAVITTTIATKICQSDYTWKTITVSDKIKCISDVNCPNSGVNTCANKKLSGWSCSGYDADIGKYCVQSKATSVACCSSSDCGAIDLICQNYKCTGGSSNTPTNESMGIGTGKEGACEDKLGGLIPASISTTKSCDWYDLLCSTGITQPKEVSECKYDYGLFILIIGGIIVVVAMILLLKPSNSTSKIKYVYRRRK